MKRDGGFLMLGEWSLRLNRNNAGMMLLFIEK